MKRFLLILAVLPLLIMGCAKNDVGIEPDGGDLPSFKLDTKATVTNYSWDDGDVVGIFMVEELYIDEGSTKKNFQFKYNLAQNKFLPDGNDNRLYFPKTTSVDFVSYRPYVANIENATNNYVYSANVTNQNEYKNIDFIYSDNATSCSEDFPDVDMTYRHMLSKIVLRFKSSTAADLTNIGNVSLTGMPTQVGFDFKTKTFGTPTNVANIAVPAAKKVIEGEVASYEVIVVPQEGLANRTIKYELSGVPAEIKFKATSIFKSGLVYYYDVAVGAFEVELADPVIVIPWVGGDEIDFGGEMDITDKFTDPIFLEYVRTKFAGGAAKIYWKDVKDEKYVDVGGEQISSLAGIEYFTNLENLYCDSNKITGDGLPLHNNYKLKLLRCFNNPLTSLDVRSNTALTRLSCYSTRLTSLDVSHNTALTILDCRSNQLTSLDVSRNTALTTLDCTSNPLTSLDVSGATALATLYCPSNQLTSLDVSRNTALVTLYCNNNTLLTSLDVSRNTALMDLRCYSTLLTSLDVSRNTALMDLRCYSTQLTSLDVSRNTALTNLYCHDNLLTSLDVSNNTTLTDLRCYENQLTSLDVSRNTALTFLNCYGNQLPSLDVSGATALTNLSCFSNQLTSLNVYGAVALTYLNCYVNLLTSLDVSRNTALTDFICNSNRLTSLDVSKNTALTYLNCYSNSLTSLDVSRNKALTTLRCYSTQLTSLDVSNNTALTELDCNTNRLTSLDVSRNTALVTLLCHDNLLTSLDISTLNIANINYIYTYNNPGNGTTAGSPNHPNPADFEVKFPLGTDLGSLPPKFPQSGSRFEWKYQFEGGVEFDVKTKYTK